LCLAWEGSGIPSRAKAHSGAESSNVNASNGDENHKEAHGNGTGGNEIDRASKHQAHGSEK